jgi:hypothetical protein
MGVKVFTSWFDKLWKIADPLTVSLLAELQHGTASLRQEYMKLKKRTKVKLQVPKKPKPQKGLSDKLQDLFASAVRLGKAGKARRAASRKTVQSAMITKCPVRLRATDV